MPLHPDLTELMRLPRVKFGKEPKYQYLTPHRYMALLETLRDIPPDADREACLRWTLAAHLHIWPDALRDEAENAVITEDDDGISSSAFEPLMSYKHPA